MRSRSQPPSIRLRRRRTLGLEGVEFRGDFRAWRSTRWRPRAGHDASQQISSSSRRTADCASTPAGNANAVEDLCQFFAMRSRDRGRRVSSPAAGPHCLGFAIFVLCVDLLSSHPACPLYNIKIEVSVALRQPCVRFRDVRHRRKTSPFCGAERRNYLNRPHRAPA